MNNDETTPKKQWDNAENAENNEIKLKTARYKRRERRDNATDC
jgi:hypothetical protein